MSTPSTAESLLDTLQELLRIVGTHARLGDGVLLTETLTGHLGVEVADIPVVTGRFPEHRFVDHDLALELLATRDPDHVLIGVGGGEMRHHRGLSDMIRAGQGPATVIGQPDYVNRAIGPTAERVCVAFGVRLFRYEGRPVAVLQRTSRPEEGRPDGSFEVLAGDRDLAKRLLAELAAVANEHSILRGQVLTFTSTGYGHESSGITFVERPDVTAEQVVLPDGVLARVRLHVLGIAEHRAALRAHGQHLKRGVLLYGPPGSGKTHTVRHLLSSSAGHTVVLLSGQTLALVGMAANLARVLQPAIVVLEDCDLIAESRDFTPGSMKPLLFEVLDAIDGLASDADVTFLLTTNRVDVMESALTQRPGRVDLATEIELPDARGREALLRLYSPVGHLFSSAAITAATEATAGTTASFAKELMRRATLRAIIAGRSPADSDLAAALLELRADAEDLSRALVEARSSRSAGGTRTGAWGMVRDDPGPGGLD